MSNLARFILTPHLRQQAQAKGIGMEVIASVLEAPSITYKSYQRTPAGKVPYTCRKCGTHQEKWTGRLGNTAICLVVNPCCGDVITVWHDGQDTELRADQRAKGVTYVGRDGVIRR